MRKGELAELRAENERLVAILESDLTFRDIEAKWRSGGWSLRALSSEDDTTTHAALLLISVLCLHVLLGADNEEPENYRSCEFGFKPGGGFDNWRLFAEIVKPGGRSSHEIRRDLEGQLAALEQRADA